MPAASSGLADSHNRQPAIIDSDRYDDWLDPTSPLPRLHRAGARTPCPSLRAARRQHEGERCPEQGNKLVGRDKGGGLLDGANALGRTCHDHLPMIPAPPFYGLLCIEPRFSDIIPKTEYYFDWQRELTMTDEISNFSIGNLSTTNMSNLEHSKYPALCRTGADGKAIAMSTIPRPIFKHLIGIGAVLAAALLLGFPAPAHADEAVLVSNIGQTDANTFFLNTNKLAQGFFTGGAGPYDLGSIEVRIDLIPENQTGSVVSASLRADDGTGKPASTSLCTLDIPSPWGSGTKRFGADNCPPLNSGTYYFVVLDFLQSNNSFSVQLTATNNEDASPAQGWSINNKYHYFYESVPTAWQESTGNEAKIRVRAANTAPTVSPASPEVTTNEDTAYTFTAGNFNFSDADSNDELASVKIATLPTAGTLTLSDNAVEANDDVTANDIGNLTYTPVANANGTPYATFGFTVSDGLHDSASATMTINVTAVNDAPVVSGSIGINYAENGTAAVATYTATDQEGATTFTWNVGESGTGGDDSIDFGIVSGVLSFNTSPDFENPTDENPVNNVYKLRVLAFDGQDNGGLDVTITVTNEDDTEASDDAVVAFVNTADIVIKVLANDSGVEGAILRVTHVGTQTAPTNGTATIPDDDDTIITYTPDADFTGIDTFSYTVSDGTTEDTATVTVTVRLPDRARPRVTITSAASAPVGGPFTVTITFSESVSGFSLADIGVSNGTASRLKKVSSRTYTATITPAASGPVEVAVGANVARDQVGNRNQPAEPFVIAADLERPTVTIKGPTESVGLAEFAVTITFSEPVADFEQADLQISNGMVTAFTAVSPSAYRATITPEASGEVKVVVEVPEDVAKDRAGNGNQPATPFVIAADLERPTVTIEGPTELVGITEFEVTITFSEPVEDFERADLQISNGMVTAFTAVSPSEYRATIALEASGAVRVAVGPDVAKDETGNGNQPAAFVIAAALQGRFGSPAAGTTVSGIDLIRGWTFAEAAGVGIAEVVVYIDGQRETTIPCCSERQDVQAAYPDFPAANTAVSGWGLTYNWDELAAGTHTLRVVATSSQGDTWESGVHTIHVLKPGEVTFADRFSLATAEVWLEAEELVLDGVVIRDKASQEEQEIEARYGWQTAVQGLQLVETTPLAAAPVESVRAGVARLLAGLAAWGRWLLNPGQVTAAAGLTAAYEAPADQTVVAGIGLIRGWAFADMGRELATVSLHIDGAARGSVPCCSRRPDVAAAYPDEMGALDSGWGLVFNYGNLAVGAHTIGVRITTEAGDVETTEHAVTVVQLGGYAFVDVFDVSGAEVWLEGEEIVLSGVEVRDKATQATQLVEVRLRWSSVTQGLTIVGSEPVP